jgi:hypothetical protein
MARTGDDFQALSTQMDIVLHVGLYKAASTTLQQEVFPRLTDLCAVGRKHPGEREDSALSLAMAEIWRGERHQRGELRRRLEEQVGDLPLLVSEEVWTSPVDHQPWDRMVRTADRLASEVPESAVLIVVRNPADLLVSSYTQYLRVGGTMSWRRFVEERDLRSYDVAAISRLYVERFPKVHILPFEELAEPDRFASRLVSAIGSDADAGAVASWLRSAHNAGLNPLFGYGQLAANRTVHVSPLNPTPPLPALDPLYYRVVSRGIAWAQRRLDLWPWRPAGERILEKRRDLALRATSGFQYPVG